MLATTLYYNRQQYFTTETLFYNRNIILQERYNILQLNKYCFSKDIFKKKRKPFFLQKKHYFTKEILFYKIGFIIPKITNYLLNINKIVISNACVCLDKEILHQGARC